MVEVSRVERACLGELGVVDAAVAHCRTLEAQQAPRHLHVAFCCAIAGCLVSCSPYCFRKVVIEWWLISKGCTW